jgi:hypothetical protein
MATRSLVHLEIEVDYLLCWCASSYSTVEKATFCGQCPDGYTIDGILYYRTALIISLFVLKQWRSVSNAVSHFSGLSHS